MVNQQLLFLKEKIQDINSAIFFNLSDAVLKLPTSIITTLKVDEFGYVWFFVERPKQQLNEFEKEFPARMDYFRKGKDYSLQIDLVAPARVGELPIEPPDLGENFLRPIAPRGFG